MFGLSDIYVKLIASAVVLGLVAGAYFYVRHLNSTITTLNRDNATLEQSNDELKENLKAQAQLQTVIEKVSEAGDKQREQNKKVHQEQLHKIDENVKAGKDKAVGPLLKEFFNE